MLGEGRGRGGSEFFVIAVDISYWLSHVWLGLLLGLSSPEQHLLCLVYRSHMSWKHLQNTPCISWMYVPNPNVFSANSSMFEALAEHAGSVWLMNNMIYFKNLSQESLKFPTSMSLHLLCIYYPIKAHIFV